MAPIFTFHIVALRRLSDTSEVDSMAGEIEVPDYNDIANEDDPFALAALVEKGGPLDVDPGEVKPNVEDARGHQFDDTKEDTTSATKQETTPDTDAGKDGGDHETKPGATDAGASKEDASGKAADDDAGGKGEKGASVKTADGEGEIPYAVLKNTREQNAQLKAEVDRLSAELEAAKNGGSTDDPTQMTPEQRQEHIQQLQAEIQSVEDDYDPDLAKPMRRLLEENLRLAKQVEQMGESLRNQPTDEDRQQDQEIQAAIDKSPVMADWYSRTDETWYKRAVQVHQAAIQSDEDYQGMSHEQRMQELPQRVQAVFGKDPEAPDPGAKPEAKPEAKPDEKPAKEAKPANSEEDVIPRSMDDLPPGGTPDPSGKFGPLGDMDGAKMTDYFGRLANQGKLDDVLANLAGPS